MDSIVSILAGIPLFQELDANERNRIAAGVHTFSLDKEGMLFNKGDPADGFYVVVVGRIKLSFISKDGKEYIAEIIGALETFGEAVMFLGKSYPVCAQALMDTTLLHVPKDVMFKNVDQTPGFARKVIAGLCCRLVDRVQALEYLTVYSSLQKVVGYLLREIEFAKPADDEADVLLPVNKVTLAAQLNLTPETLSRVLHKLTEEKLISVKGNAIHICHIGKLRKFGS
ncbi:MAG: Crp/Fnr family transcriptional regulator [Gammaproteobacteria bacterium]|nr:Crp/Fnr family transcriptional regulator [Gammaproteobacteria bacterium]